MKLSWPIRLDIGCFVGQVIAGTFDDDYPALIVALEILTETARAEVRKSLLPPVQIK